MNDNTYAFDCHIEYWRDPHHDILFYMFLHNDQFPIHAHNDQISAPTEMNDVQINLYGFFFYKMLNRNRIFLRLKISIMTDISVLRFYGYIGYIGDISVDILAQNIVVQKLIKSLGNVRKKLLEMDLEV